MSAPKIRFLSNLVLDVKTYYGDVVQKGFGSGKYTLATHVSVYKDDPEYCDVHLNNGDVIEGLKMSAISLHGNIEIVELDRGVEPSVPDPDPDPETEPPKTTWWSKSDE